MANDFEQGRTELNKLADWAREHDYAGRRNEADTRLQLIDQLLFNCLGWNQEDCHAEERFEGKYSDYSLGKPRRLIVEAKREGIYFELPAGFDKRVCNLETLFAGNEAIEQAVRQCLSYCLDRGAPIGAVCNGHQIVAFIGGRSDGIPPLEGQCLVFRSLEDMVTDYRTIWDNLSKSGVSVSTLLSTLKRDTGLPPPEKLSHRIPDYPGFKNRNPFQTDLKILGELFIEDVVRAPELEDEFLQSCYAKSGALSQHALISKQILQARYSSLFEKEMSGPSMQPVQTKHGLSEDFAADVFAASLKRRAIILLGDVGVGKSIFIRNLVKIEAREVFKKAISLYIDFGKEPALAGDLENFVLSRCSAQLLKDNGIDIEANNFVRGVYHGDLIRFSRGIYSPLSKTNPEAYAEKETEFLREQLQNKSGHLRASLNHISKAQRRQIVIFLDNVDQRPLDFQERVFLIGQSLAEGWPATVFISLRPDTFYLSKTKGSLTAYQPRVFTIAPARVDQVIILRLQFVLDQLKSSGTLRSLSSGVSLGSTSLNEYVEVLLYSFERSKQLIQFIDNVSGGNTRSALALITAFIGSGHVNAEKILDVAGIRDVAGNRGSYTIPVHEFIRAVIYGDFEHYDSNASPISNLFDISSPDGKEHFLLGNVLAFIQRSADHTTEGFVEAARVYDFCQGLGFLPSQIDFALERARFKNLVDPIPRFGEGPPESYRITSAGAYTFMELSKEFSYVDAMIVDTPIIDPEYRPRIGNVSAIHERADRMELFLDYLDAQHSMLTSRAVVFEWLSASAALRSTIRRLKQLGPRKAVKRRTWKRR